MNVILAETDVNLCRMISSLLQRKGIDCSWVTSVGRFFEACEQETFDLVILDAGLVTDELLKIVRKAGSGGISVPVILLVDRQHEEDAVRYMEAGVDEVIVKPLHYERLFAVIGKYQTF